MKLLVLLIALLLVCEVVPSRADQMPVSDAAAERVVRGFFAWYLDRNYSAGLPKEPKLRQLATYFEPDLVSLLRKAKAEDKTGVRVQFRLSAPTPISRSTRTCQRTWGQSALSRIWTRLASIVSSEDQ
jgi:hypothetical protein